MATSTCAARPENRRAAQQFSDRHEGLAAANRGPRWGTAVWLIGIAAALPAQRNLRLGGPALEHGNAVFDTQRERVVAFDGQTWELDGGTWLLRPIAPPGDAPAPRRHPAMTYDPLRRHVLLFGGRNANALTTLGDTWIYDGTAWRQQPGLGGPGRRERAAMTFDSARGRVLMFGGYAAGQQLTDTWEHDGQVWILRTPTNSPPQDDVAMTYDSLRGRAVLTANDSLQTFTQLWEWDGIDWNRVATVPVAGAWPFTRFGTSVVYDATRQRTVVVGGADSFGPAPIWEWDGINWSSVVSLMEWNRLDPATWHVPGAAGIAVAGGVTQAGQPRHDRWQWDGVVATQVERRDAPAAMHLARAAWWDERRDEFTVFGNAEDVFGNDDTWVWNGTSWRLAAPSQRPAIRVNAAATYDPVRGTGLLFGGSVPRNASLLMGDLWAFDGVDWRQLTWLGPGPSPRQGAAMAFDRSRGVAVLFGGRTSLSTSSAETWEWDGVRWSLVPTTGGPAARFDHLMTWDPGRARTILHGGNGTSTNSTASWMWDGAIWSRLLPDLPAPANAGAWLDFDPVRQRLVVARKEGSADQSWWEHDGANWLQVASPPSAAANAHAFDPVRRRHLLLTGSVLEEWALDLALVDRLGTGCGAPTPTLAARTHARIGEAEFGLEVATVPAAFAIVGLADTAAAIPLGGGCTLMVGNLLATSVQLADPRGLAIVRIPLPLRATLRGLQLFSQAATIDAAGRSALTNGLLIKVGD